MEIPVLDTFLNHNDPIVAEAATLLNTFTQQVRDGEMTKDEFLQLSRDLLDMKRINDLTNDIDRKAAIAEAFSLIYNLISTFGSSLL